MFLLTILTSLLPLSPLHAETQHDFSGHYEERLCKQVLGKPDSGLEPSEVLDIYHKDRTFDIKVFGAYEFFTLNAQIYSKRTKYPEMSLEQAVNRFGVYETGTDQVSLKKAIVTIYTDGSKRRAYTYLEMQLTPKAADRVLVNYILRVKSLVETKEKKTVIKCVYGKTR